MVASSRTFLMVVSALTVSSRAFCFGDVGHLSVCKLAYDLASAKTRSALDGIVGSRNAFAEQCVWPDMVKKMKPWNFTGNY
ncbi:MAG: S1/P1 nuclease, partial [Pseudomonadota bacterium]